MSDPYRPKTQVAVKLNQQIIRDIATDTGVPLAKVMKYSDRILSLSMFQTIQDMETNINKYVPKATGQLRDKLIHSLHNSTLQNNVLNMRLGTTIHYLKYVANMKEEKLRHPRSPLKGTYKNYEKYPIYQRNSKHGKKGQAKRNPGQWRYVHYYGGARWVKLNDPKAQENFYSLLVKHMRDKLEKYIAEEIRDIIPSNQRRPYYNEFKVIRK